MKKAFWVLPLFLLLFLLSGCGQSEQQIHSLEDLNGKTLAIYSNSQAGYTLAEEYPEINQVYLFTVSDMLLQLRQGKIDAFCMDYPTYVAMARTENDIVCLDEPVCRSYTILYFAETDRSKLLLSQFNELLARYREDGTLSALEDKWFYSDAGESDGVDFSGTDGETEISIAYATQNYPYIYLIGDEIAGYEADLLTAFCREYGYSQEINSVSWESMAAGVAVGTYEIGSGNIMYSGESTIGVIASDPISEYDVVVVVLNESAEKTGLLTKISQSFTKTFLEENRWLTILKGLGVTAALSVLAVLLGTVFGFVLYMLLRRETRLNRVLENAYLCFVRRTPAVVILMIFCYILFPGGAVPLFLISVFAFAFLFGADVLSGLTAAVSTVDAGQRRAALALGYTERQAFFRVVLPQAQRLFLPGWRNSVLALVQSTSIVGYVAVQDLTMAANLIRSRIFDPFGPLIAAAIVYFLLAWLLERLTLLLIHAVDNRRRSPEKILKGADKA